MKKCTALLLALTMSIMGLTACGGNTAEPSAEAMDMRIGGLKGPTSIGMVKLMEEAEEGSAANRYTFTIAGSADEIVPKLSQGELDLAMVPANLASVLYNNTDGGVQLLAINTLGVISIVENGESVQSFADLKGKTIYATGKSAVPEYALRYILSQNGLNPERDITIEWKSEPTEVVALLSQGEGIAMLPQPFVTAAQMQMSDLRIAIDLNEAWNALDNGSLFLTGVLIGRREFLQQNPEQIAAFLSEYEASTKWVNENVGDAAALAEKFDIVKAAVAEKAIPHCNITYLDGAEMKTAMNGYLKILMAQNPQSIGGALPDDAFYHES